LEREFGLPGRTSVTKKLNTAIKRVGLIKVFDTNFTADLTVMEEGTELLLRLKKALVDKFNANQMELDNNFDLLVKKLKASMQAELASKVDEVKKKDREKMEEELRDKTKEINDSLREDYKNQLAVEIKVHRAEIQKRKQN